MDATTLTPKASATKEELEQGMIRLAALLTAVEWANDHCIEDRKIEQDEVRDALIHIAKDLAKELSERI